MRRLRQFGMALVVTLLFLAAGHTLTQADSLQQGGSIRPVQKIWMSDKPNGAALTIFPSGLKTVYVVFDYKDAADAEIQVRVLDPKGATIFLETKKYSGAGRENLEMTASDPLSDGSYVTNVYVSLNGNLFLSESNEWNVGKASSAPQPTTAAPAQQPAQQPAQPAAPNPASKPAAQPVNAAPAQPAVVGDSGVSAPMLIGAGILVVGLLALVVWAVRGFLNAPKASS
ncbi:MAG: hypothetical protein KIT87_07020 [Anaerolineae bacterium]|nr:hypothetical protein [Anaerolineae bacterium]